MGSWWCCHYYSWQRILRWSGCSSIMILFAQGSTKMEPSVFSAHLGPIIMLPFRAVNKLTMHAQHGALAMDSVWHVIQVMVMHHKTEKPSVDSVRYTIAQRLCSIPTVKFFQRETNVRSAFQDFLLMRYSGV